MPCWFQCTVATVCCPPSCRFVAAEPAGGAGGGEGGEHKKQESHSGPTATVPVSYVPASKDALSRVSVELKEGV